MMVTTQFEKARTLFRGDRDPLRDFIRLLEETLTQRGARSFRRSVLEAASGDIVDGLEGLTIHIDDFQDIYEQAFRRAGRAQSRIVGGFQLDEQHPRVIRYLRSRSTGLIDDLDDVAREGMRVALSRGAANGLQPEEIAQRIKPMLSLSPRDVNAVENLRSGIKGQSRGLVARRVKEYTERLLEARAMVIARTEMIDAIEFAKQELIEQAVEAGLLARKDVWRVWVTFEDERVCPICRPLDGAKARIGGEFRKGGQRSPRPPAHPNCRCDIKYEIARLRVRKHGGGSHDDKSHGNWVRGGGKGPQYANEGFPKQAVKVSSKAFYSGFSQAREGRYGAFLSDFDLGDFEADNVRTFIAFDGRVGGVLTDHDDGRIEVGSLYALPGAPDGAGRDLLRYLIHEKGGNWLNNFDGVLTEFYIAEGFKVLTTDPWSDQFAPRNWKYDEFGRPDYITMGTKAVRKHDTKGRNQGQRGLLGSDEKTDGEEGRRGADGLSGSSVGDGQGIRDDRPEGGPLDKHGGGSHDEKDHGNWADGNTVLADLHTYVDMVVTLQEKNRNPDLKYPGNEALVKKYGQEFQPPRDTEHNQELMAEYGVDSGVFQECFVNSGQCVVSGSSELTYVEGMAASLIPMHHAWLVTPEGQVIDPTWGQGDISPGLAYFGIPFTDKAVLKSSVKNQVWGMIGYWNHRYWRDGIPKGDLASSQIGKHYGPGPHPGTNTPQKIHGLREGIPALADEVGAYPEWARKFVEPFIFTFRTPDDVQYDSVVTFLSRSNPEWTEVNWIEIGGELHADDGEMVGKFTRTLLLDAKEVDNKTFRVEEPMQGEGVGLTWLNFTERRLGVAGFETMEVSAEHIGRYAWAKYGYTWLDVEGRRPMAVQWWEGQERVSHGSSLGSMKSIELWNGLVERAQQGDYPEPHEIAVIPDIGKYQFLNSRAWTGVKEIKSGT